MSIPGESAPPSAAVAASPGSLPGPPGGLPRAGSRLAVYLEATRLHGDVVLVDEQLPTILVSHPEHVRHVLQDNQLNYRQNLRRRILMGRRSLALSSGEEWRHRRRLMQPLFRPPRLARLAPKMTRASAELVERWRGAAARGEPVDVAAEMAKLTLDILIDALLGDEAGQGGRLRRAVAAAFDYFNARARGRTRLPALVPTPRNLRLLRALAELKAAVTETVAERRGAANPEDDLLSMLIAARDEQTGAVMDDEQLKDELMMLLVMGHMTTAMAITWIWHLLARHPEVDERVRAEMAAVTGGRPPEPRDVAELGYTRRVIDEALRLYPPSWSLSRRAIAEDEIGGYRIPAGALVVMSPWVTHRRPELWESPERFDPDRFLPERAAARPRFAYYPFGGGPRVCIARDLAMLELPLILGTVGQAYRLRGVPGRRVVPQPGIVLQPRGGLPMRLEPAAGGTGTTPAAAPAAAPALATIAELALLAGERGGAPALLHKVDGRYRPIGGAELRGQVERLARALVRLGLEPGERVALLAGNGPLWPVVDLAVLAAGGVTVAVHPAAGAEEAARQLRDSGAVVAFVGGPERLAEMAALAARPGELPRVRRFVALEPPAPDPAAAGPEAAAGAGAPDRSAPDAAARWLPWSALLAQGGEGGDGSEGDGAAPAAAAERLAALVRQRRPDDPATLVYTPGTAGAPRPVLLTHRNLAANVLGLAAALDVRPGDTAFSFLPLAHPYERVFHYLYLYRGAAVAYAGSAATAERDLRQVEPHLFTSVPEAWKRYLNWVFDTIQSNPPWRRRVFRLAVRIGRAALPHRTRRERPPGALGWQLALADRLVFARLRRAFFGRRLRFAVSGGSRLPHGWITFLWASGIPVFEGYGLCEAGPAVTLNTAAAVVPGSAGAALPGVELALGRDDEILVRGPSVARSGAGPTIAAGTGGAGGGVAVPPAAVDGAGWLHTGDVGMLDDAGMLHVLGRREDLFESPEGRRIAPVPLAGLLQSSHFIARALVVGGGRAATGALVVPDFEFLATVCRRRGIAAASRQEMVSHPRVREIYAREIAGFNRDLAAHDQIKVWELLADEWSAGSGELSPTGAVRRQAMLERYRDAVDRLCSSGPEQDSPAGPAGPGRPGGPAGPAAPASR
jgi:long-subunit acyl-CoA synthetase (AMP-forming)/cytochrome P450